MKIITHSLIVVACGALGIAFGFLWKEGQRPATKYEISPAPVQRFHPKSSFFSKRGDEHRMKHTDDSLVAQLERFVEKGDAVTRWLYWMEAIENAELTDFLHLAQMARGDSDLLRVLGTRWVELDPQHMFNTSIASLQQGAGGLGSGLLRVLLDEWPKRDIDAVIAVLSKSDVLASERRSFVVSLINKDPERGLRLWSEWNVQNFGPPVAAVAKWAASDPRHAAEFAMKYPAGHASRVVFETIGKEWAKRDPAAGLEFALQRRGEYANALANSVLKSWTDRNLTEAAEWLAKRDQVSRNQLSPGLVEAWAKYDAKGALAWCQANLTGVTLERAAGALVTGAVKQDLVGSADLINAMTPSPARSVAAAVLMREWIGNSSFEESFSPVSATAKAWLSSLDAASVKRALDTVQWRWSETDPKGFADFITSLPPEKLAANTYSTLARSMARKDPSQALDWANQLPENRRVVVGIEAFKEWHRSQSESARQWLNSLSADDRRRQPFFQNMVSAIASDPRGTEQLLRMTPAEQNAARELIGKMSMPEERRIKLLDMLKAQ